MEFSGPHLSLRISYASPGGEFHEGDLTHRTTGDGRGSELDPKAPGSKQNTRRKCMGGSDSAPGKVLVGAADSVGS